LSGDRGSVALSLASEIPKEVPSTSLTRMVSDWGPENSTNWMLFELSLSIVSNSDTVTVGSDGAADAAFGSVVIDARPVAVAVAVAVAIFSKNARRFEVVADRAVEDKLDLRLVVVLPNVFALKETAGKIPHTDTNAIFTESNFIVDLRCVCWIGC